MTSLQNKHSILTGAGGIGEAAANVLAVKLRPGEV